MQKIKTIKCEEMGIEASLIFLENEPVVPGNVGKIKKSM